MMQKMFSIIAGTLFALVALAHLGRITQGWDITAAGMAIPMWVSWVGLVVTAILAFFGFKLGLESGKIQGR